MGSASWTAKPRFPPVSPVSSSQLWSNGSKQTGRLTWLTVLVQFKAQPYCRNPALSQDRGFLQTTCMTHELWTQKQESWHGHQTASPWNSQLLAGWVEHFIIFMQGNKKSYTLLWFHPFVSISSVFIQLKTDIIFAHSDKVNIPWVEDRFHQCSLWSHLSFLFSRKYKHLQS